MFLANESPTPTPTPVIWAGIDQPTWSIITGVGAVVATLISILVALYTLKAADRREHHRWLQEKRREAYVTFMTAARDAYDAIADRGKKVGAPRFQSDFSKDEWPEHQDEEADIDKKLADARADIDSRLAEVMRAQDVLSIVGPEEMEKLGRRVVARLKLDRGYYSPEGFSNRSRPADKERILHNVKATDNDDFVRQVKAAYDSSGAVNGAAFQSAFEQHRLEGFWKAFNMKARSVIKESKPGRHR